MKSITGFILSLVGAILSICLSVIVGIIGILSYLGRGALIDSELSPVLISFAGNLSFWLIFSAVWFLLIGILGAIFSSRMIKESGVKKGGIWCLILGILGINLFMIIGGSIGMMSGGSKQNSRANQKISPNRASEYVKSIQQQS